MGLAVQIILASVYIIAVECHFDIFNPLGSILHGPEKQHRWHHNIFNPAFSNRQPNNIYDSGDYGYGHGVNNGPIQNGYGSDGTILTYDNYGPHNGYTSLEEHGIPENPDYHEYKEINENDKEPDEGTLSENDNVPSHDSSGVTEKISEENNEHDSKKETDNESGVTDDASVLPDKNKLLEDVVVNNDPKTSGDNKYKINTPNTNLASPNSNTVVSNAILVPIPNNAGVQSNGGKIIGTDAASNLPVINVNGALYYYINPANNQVTTQKPAQIILLPTNGGKPLLNIGTGSVNTVPVNPNYVILNGNGQTSQPLNDGKNTNGGVNIADIIFYIQQHPGLLQTNINTASNVKTNTINNAVSTSSNTSPVRPTQNSGIQTNIGISSEQVANTLISFMQQHPEIFGTNAVSSNAPSTVPNGNVVLDNRNNIPNAAQGGANNPSTVPNNAIDVSGAVSSNANQPLQNTGSGNQGNSGVTTNDVQGVIAFILQHPEIFAINAVSSNAPSTVPNGNVGLDNRNNIPNAGQGGANNPSIVPNNAIDVSGAVSSNANQPLQNTGSGNQGNSGVTTNDVQGVIAFISQHPGIFATNAVSSNAPSTVPNGNVGLDNRNNIPNAGQGGANNPSTVPNNAIDVSGAVSSNENQPLQNTGSANQGNNGVATTDVQGIIAFISQHPEIFAANTIVPNSNTNPVQGTINSNLPNGEPHAAIGASNNVKIPVNSQGLNSQVNNGIAENGASKECDLIAFLTQHPELFVINKSSGGAINSNINQHLETSSPVTTTVSPLPSSNGNMPSYVVVQSTGHQTTNQPPNDSGNGLPLKTNSFNNDGNNGNVDINVPISVLGLSNTKDLEDVKVNKKVTDAEETPIDVGAMSATKDSEELLVASDSEIITSTLLPVADADAVLQETTTETATEK